MHTFMHLHDAGIKVVFDILDGNETFTFDAPVSLQDLYDRCETFVKGSFFLTAANGIILYASHLQDLIAKYHPDHPIHIVVCQSMPFSDIDSDKANQYLKLVCNQDPTREDEVEFDAYDISSFSSIIDHIMVEIYNRIDTFLISTDSSEVKQREVISTLLSWSLNITKRILVSSSSPASASASTSTSTSTSASTSTSTSTSASASVSGSASGSASGSGSATSSILSSSAKRYHHMYIEPEASVTGSVGLGKGDYSCRLDETDIMVTEAKKDDFVSGFTQNIVQTCAAVETRKKRKFPMANIMYGIVCSAFYYYFVKYDFDNSYIYKSYRVSLSTRPSRDEVTKLLGIMVKILHDQYSNALVALSSNNKRFKPSALSSSSS